MVSASTVKRRSTQRLAGRKRPSYYESDNDEFDHRSDTDAETQGPSTKRRSARQVAARERIVEDDSEVDAELEQGDFAQGLQPAPRRPRQRKARPVTRSIVNSRRTSQRPRVRDKKKGQSRLRAFGAPLKKRDTSEAQKPGFTGPSDGTIPNWTALPPLILRDIFIYASNPLGEQPIQGLSNSTWLLRAARTCRAFAVPALEAYYLSPPILNTAQPHFLLELLGMPKEKTYIDYRVKVKSLTIDAKYLAYTATGKPLFDLRQLVEQLPRLQHLEVPHPTDVAPFRTPRKLRWTHPMRLFRSLVDSGIQLKSWRWSREMVPPEMLANLYSGMIQVHRSHAFESIVRLVVCGFDVHNSINPGASNTSDDERDLDLAAAVSTLPHLKDLTFISCDLIMDKFLDHIPNNLERLELSNCLEVYSDLIQRYLASGGAYLRHLELSHNLALSLAFLPGLKLSCPRLETLKMNLTYYSERYNSNDASALYDQLLAADEVPSWPSTLQYLQLEHLQKWSPENAQDRSPEAAQNLVRSLLDSAKELPDLRHLIIQAHIDIPWRDRAGFREQWIDRLQRVYLRRTKDPNAHYGSLRQFRQWRESTSRTPTRPASNPTPSTLTRTGQGTSPQVHVLPLRTSDNPGLYKRYPTLRRSERVAEGVHSSTGPSTSESESEGSEDDERRLEAEEEGLFVQGLCEVVDIRIDNQRPREKQWTEGEFLGSEVSGDEDWCEDADMVDDDGYAW